MTEELKPCLRCGSHEIGGWYIRDGWQVSCRKCGLAIGHFNPMARERAVDKWNTRPIEDALQAENAKLRERVAELEAAIEDDVYYAELDE